MRPKLARTVVRFVVIFAVVLCALAVGWPHVAPAYTTAVATLARPVLRAVEAPNVTVLDARGDELGVYRIVGENRIAPVVVFDRYLFFAVVLLVALFAATPGLGVRRRVARTVAGLGLLLVLHVAYLVASVELVYAVAAGRAVGGWQVAVRVLWEAAPILIWVVLTAGAWKRVLAASRAEGIEGSESPIAGPIGAEG